MTMDRRQFLFSALALGAWQLCPLKTLASEEIPRVTLDVHVSDIPGDRLSQDFHGDHLLWDDILNRVKKFYASTVEIDARKRKWHEFDRTALARDHIGVKYLTPEDYFLKTPPWDLIFERGGQPHVDEIKEAMKSYQVEGGDAESALLKRYGTTLYEKMGTSIDGLANKDSHIVAIFPHIMRNFSTSELTTGVAARLCHEIGHSLGLQHANNITVSPFGVVQNYSYRPNNFMNQANDDRIDATFDISIDDAQKRSIQQFLRSQS